MSASDKDQATQFNRKTFVLLGLLILITTALFMKVHTYDFVNWDDDVYVLNNPAIRSLSWHHIQQWFKTPQVSLFIPLPMASFAIDYIFYHNNPGGYHLTNLLLHVVNIGMVFWLFLQIFRNPLLAFGGALLWGIHPVQVDSFAWISERKNLMSGLFFLWGFNLFAATHQDSPIKAGKTIAIFLLMLAAMLSKITAVVVPFVLMAYDFFYARSFSIKKTGIYFTLAAIGVAIGLFTLALYPKEAIFYKYFNTLPAVLIRQTPFLLNYLVLIFFPKHIELLYPHPTFEILSRVPLIGWVIGAAGILLSAFTLAIIFRKKFGFWIAWFLIFLSPVIIFPITLANHHLYLPLVGLIGILLYFSTRLGRLAAAGLLIICVFLTPISLNHLGIWENSETLWKSVLEKYHENKKAILNLAFYYQEKNQPQLAIELYKRVIALHPRDTFAYTNLAGVYVTSYGDYLNARRTIRAMHQVSPKNPDCLISLAGIASREGKTDLEISYLAKALMAGSHSPSLYLNLGMAHFRKGLYPGAIEYLTKGISLNNRIPVTRFHLGLAYLATQKWNEAISVFEAMLDDRMEQPGIYFQLGYAYLKSGKREKAKKFYFESIHKQPQISQAFYHLGLMALQAKQMTDALLFFEQALKADPTSNLYREQLEKTKKELTGDSPPLH